MQYRALATDYDGTLATHGDVDHATIDALGRFSASGGALIMVTGRQLFDLRRVFPDLDIFSLVVAENGALLYRPATREETLLSAPASEAFVTLLRNKGVPISVGRAVVASVEPYEDAVREAIQEADLRLNVILNKGSIMVLPDGVNKTTGLNAALAELRIDLLSVVGIGDAENDIDFLRACGYGVAVANALPSVKSGADFVTRGTHGAGVVEVIEHLFANDGLPSRRSISNFLVPE